MQAQAKRVRKTLENYARMFYHVVGKFFIDEELNAMFSISDRQKRFIIRYWMEAGWVVQTIKNGRRVYKFTMEFEDFVSNEFELRKAKVLKKIIMAKEVPFIQLGVEEKAVVNELIRERKVRVINLSRATNSLLISMDLALDESSYASLPEREKHLFYKTIDRRSGRTEYHLDLNLAILGLW